MLMARLVRVLPVAVVLALLAPTGRSDPQPEKSEKSGSPKKEEKKIDDAGMMEVRFEDESSMKIKLLDEKIELVTKHGVLRFAPTDVRKIEFATRVPPEVAEKAQTAIGKLNSPDFNTREAATEELKTLREQAYPFILKATKSDDAEISNRAEEIAKYIRGKVPSEKLVFREFDVVYTDDSKNTGKITGDSLRFSTLHFGEQKVKLNNIVSLRSSIAQKEEDVAAIPAPVNLLAYANRVGQEFVFKVTGVANGTIYGTDIYTLDSSFAMAAVHAGIVKNGETGTVRVKILGQVNGFAASTRNGVTSNNYGGYPGFEIVRKKP